MNSERGTKERAKRVRKLARVCGKRFVRYARRHISGIAFVFVAVPFAGWAAWGISADGISSGFAAREQGSLLESDGFESAATTTYITTSTTTTTSSTTTSTTTSTTSTAISTSTTTAMTTTAIITTETLSEPEVYTEEVEEYATISTVSEDELIMLARTLAQEGGDCSYTQQACVIWTVLNRVDSDEWPNTIAENLLMGGQFAYYPWREYRADHYQVVCDVVSAWENGGDRLIGPDYQYFYGDGTRNHFYGKHSSEYVPD